MTESQHPQQPVALALILQSVTQTLADHLLQTSTATSQVEAVAPVVLVPAEAEMADALVLDVNEVTELAAVAEENVFPKMDDRRRHKRN